MPVVRLLSELRAAETDLADVFRRVEQRHPDEPDVARNCDVLARQCVAHANRLGPSLARYAGDVPDAEIPEPTRTDILRGRLRRRAARTGERRRPSGLALLADLSDLYVAISRIEVLWVQAGQVAQAQRDSELLDTATQCNEETATQRRWVTTRIKEVAAQTLVVR